ncbi:MAG TPA: FtsX-like permease family protein [Coriobacteriia bacterium]
MRILLLKTWRDLLTRKGQFAALILLIALGILSYVAFLGGYLDLTASVEKATTELKFADFTVSVLGAPAGEVAAIARIPGVRAVEGRLIVDTGLDVGEEKQPLARVIGVPFGRRSRVNDLLVQQGRYLAPTGRDEALLDAKYAVDTGTEVGDTITLRLGGERKRLRVVGIVASPEYMYAIPEKGALPTFGEFAVIWVWQRDVEEIFGRPGTVTDVAVLVDRGANLGVVIDRVEEVLEPYRIVRTVKQADQPSAFALNEEIKQNSTMAIYMPALILAISSSSLFIALSRLVTSQRGQIGLAKALGYTDGQILLHYLLFSLVIAAGGSGLGILFGDLAGRAIAQQYVDMLGIPYLDHNVYPSVLAGAVAISTAACVLAGLAPAWKSARMAPANAMRSDPNLALAGGRRPLVERLFGWALPRTFTFRIPLRNVFRARRRTIYTILGIAFAMVLTVATRSSFDSIGSLIDKVFTTGERWDVMAAYDVPFGGGRLNEIRRWGGVSAVQGALMVPAELKAGGSVHEGVLTAMEPGATFHGFDITEGAEARDVLAKGDLVVSVGLARKLGVGVGATLSAKTPYRDERQSLRVGAISDEPLGAPAYISLARARELLGTGVISYNALYANVDPRRAEAVKDDLFDLPGAVSVNVKAGMLGSLVQMMEFANFYEGILYAFGWAMAFVVIYTTFTSNVLERMREIATMRTIGESNARLAVMITVENVLLAIVGIPLGVWLGKLAADAIYASFSSEAYSLKATLSVQSVVALSAATLGVLVLSEIPAIRRIFRMDLAEATKVME